MAHLIDKSALVAEIEKRMQELRPTNTHQIQVGEKMDRDVLMWLNALTWVKDFINTLEVKEVDLEKAIDDYIYTHNGRKRLALELDWKYCNLTLEGGNEIIKFAKYFFELGLKAQKEE